MKKYVYLLFLSCSALPLLNGMMGGKSFRSLSGFLEHTHYEQTLATDRFAFLTHARTSLAEYRTFSQKIANFYNNTTDFTTASAKKQLADFINQYAAVIKGFVTFYKTNVPFKDISLNKRLNEDDSNWVSTAANSLVQLFDTVLSLQSASVLKIQVTGNSAVSDVNAVIQLHDYMRTQLNAVLASAIGDNAYAQKVIARFDGGAAAKMVPMFVNAIGALGVQVPLSKESAQRIIAYYQQLHETVKKYEKTFSKTPIPGYADNKAIFSGINTYVTTAYEHITGSMQNQLVTGITVTRALPILEQLIPLYSQLSQAYADEQTPSLVRVFSNRSKDLHDAVALYKKLQGASLTAASAQQYMTVYNKLVRGGARAVGTSMLSGAMRNIIEHGSKQLNTVIQSNQTALHAINGGTASHTQIDSCLSALVGVVRSVSALYMSVNSISAALSPAQKIAMQELQEARALLDTIAKAYTNVRSIVSFLDGKSPVNIGQVYHLCSSLATQFSNMQARYSSEGLSSYVPAVLLLGNGIESVLSAMKQVVKKKLGNAEQIYQKAQQAEKALNSLSWHSDSNRGVYGARGVQQWLGVLNMYLTAHQMGYEMAAQAFTSALNNVIRSYHAQSVWFDEVSPAEVASHTNLLTRKAFDAVAVPTHGNGKEQSGTGLTIQIQHVMHEQQAKLYTTLGMFGLAYYGYLFADTASEKEQAQSYAHQCKTYGQQLFAGIQALKNQAADAVSAHQFNRAVLIWQGINAVDHMVQSFGAEQQSFATAIGRSTNSDTSMDILRSFSKKSISYKLPAFSHSISLPLITQQLVSVATSGVQYYSSKQNYKDASLLYGQLVGWYQRIGNSAQSAAAHRSYETYRTLAVAHEYLDSIVVASTKDIPFSFAGKPVVIKKVPTQYYAKTITHPFPENQPLPVTLKGGGTFQQKFTALMGMLMTSLQENNQMSGSDIQSYLADLETRATQGMTINGKKVYSSVVYDAATRSLVETYVPLQPVKPKYPGQESVQSTYYLAYRLYNTPRSQSVSIGTATYSGGNSAVLAAQVGQKIAQVYLSIGLPYFESFNQKLAQVPGAHDTQVQPYLQSYTTLYQLYQSIYRNVYYALYYYKKYSKNTVVMEKIHHLIPTLCDRFAQWCGTCLVGNPYGQNNRSSYQSMLGSAQQWYYYAQYYYKQGGAAGKARAHTINTVEKPGLDLKTAQAIIKYPYTPLNGLSGHNYYGAIPYYQSAMNGANQTSKKGVVEVVNNNANNSSALQGAYGVCFAYLSGAAQSMRWFGQAANTGVTVAGSTYKVSDLISQYKQWNGGDFNVSNAVIQAYNRTRDMLLNAMIYGSSIQEWFFQLSKIKTKKSTSNSGKKIKWPHGVSLTGVKPLTTALKDSLSFFVSPMASGSKALEVLMQGLLKQVNADGQLHPVSSPPSARAQGYNALGTILEDLYSMCGEQYVKLYTPKSDSVQAKWQALENAMRAHANDLTAPPTAYV